MRGGRVPVWSFVGYNHSAFTIAGGTVTLDADFDPASDRQTVTITDEASGSDVTDGTTSRPDAGLILDAATSSGIQDRTQFATITPAGGSPETRDIAVLRMFGLRNPDSGATVTLYEYGFVDELSLPGGGILVNFGEMGFLATGPIVPGVVHDVLFSGTPNPATAPQFGWLTDALCFCAGTLIATPDGPRPVEDIRPGDPVATRDNGVQGVRRAEWRQVSAAWLIAEPRHRPVLIPADALGRGVPASDLRVSRQHRLLITGNKAARRWGRAEVLIAAAKLIGWRGIRRDDSCRPVAYHHLLCDRHEILFANGAPAESLLPEADRRHGGGRPLAVVVN